MNNQINIAELLKDCPKGMELDCLLYDNVTFERFDVEQNRCYFKAGPADTFWTTCYGKVNGSPFGKCVIFPKNKTTWKGFVPPYSFNDGDIVATINGLFVGIVEVKNNKPVGAYCSIDYVKDFRINSDYVFDRLATTWEKQKLFDAIKAKGYKWNAETKTLEKLPKFKVGDRVKKNKDYISGIVTDIFDDSFKVTYDGGGCSYVQFHCQDDWELVSNKFDITTLVPFESRVLMRSSNAREWVATFYSHYSNNKFYGCGMCCDQCIPYEGNQHLLGTTNECSDYYKNW